MLRVTTDYTIRQYTMASTKADPGVCDLGVGLYICQKIGKEKDNADSKAPPDQSLITITQYASYD